MHKGAPSFPGKKERSLAAVAPMLVWVPNTTSGILGRRMFMRFELPTFILDQIDAARASRNGGFGKQRPWTTKLWCSSQTWCRAEARGAQGSFQHQRAGGERSPTKRRNRYSKPTKSWRAAPRCLCFCVPLCFSHSVAFLRLPFASCLPLFSAPSLALTEPEGREQS